MIKREMSEPEFQIMQIVETVPGKATKHGFDMEVRRVKIIGRLWWEDREGSKAEPGWVYELDGEEGNFYWESQLREIPADWDPKFPRTLAALEELIHNTVGGMMVNPQEWIPKRKMKQALALDSPLAELGIPGRLVTAIQEFLGDAASIKDLVELTPRELLGFPNVGRASLREVAAKLRSHGMELKGYTEYVLEEAETWAAMITPPPASPEAVPGLLALTFRAAGMPLKICNILINRGALRTIGDLVKLSLDDLRAIHGVGSMATLVVLNRLANMGLHLRDEPIAEIHGPDQALDGELETGAYFDGELVGRWAKDGIKTIGDLVKITAAELLARYEEINNWMIADIRVTLGGIGWSLAGDPGGKRAGEEQAI